MSEGSKRAGHAGTRGWIGPALIIGAFAALVLAERSRPLRRETESHLRRDVRNLCVAALSAATLQVVERPVVKPLAEFVEERRIGLLPRLGLPRRLETALAVLLMDYTLYLWHVLTHRAPFLWRFHKVHHVDLDLSASTALRFHFGEMAMSVPWRAAQVVLIGTSPRALGIWQKFLFLSIMFHHSNLRLPANWERPLVRFLVTPRMHGIHHSVVEEEVNSNWSSGLTVWDWLHGTLRLDLPQNAITIGVAAYRDPEDVTLPKLIEMPFVDPRSGLLLPDGTRPRREPLPKPHGILPA